MIETKINIEFMCWSKKDYHRNIGFHVAYGLYFFPLVFLSTVWNRGATVIQSLTRQPFAHFPVQIANQDSFKQQLSGTGSDRPGRGVLHHMWVMEVLSSPGLKSILWCAQTLLITTPLLQTCRTRLSCLIV